jgi:hypothetical protein
MGEGNFEVMPLGSIVEIQEMRKFVNQLIAITEVSSGNDEMLLQNLLSKIAEIREFYTWHVEKYPVAV